MLRVSYLYNRSPQFGVGRRGSPRFVPTCSDFPLFFRFVPICVPCFREYPDLFRFALFSSDLFRFVFRTNQKKIRETRFCRPLLQIPDTRGWTKAMAKLWRSFPDLLYPKDPAVLKTLQDSESLHRSVFSMPPPRFATLWALLWEERCL